MRLTNTRVRDHGSLLLRLHTHAVGCRPSGQGQQEASAGCRLSVRAGYQEDQTAEEDAVGPSVSHVDRAGLVQGAPALSFPALPCHWVTGQVVGVSL